MLLIILSMLLIIVYTIVLCIKDRCIPYSISATYYALKHKFWFGLTMVGTAILLMPSILVRSTDTTSYMAFLACVGIIMVGVAPNFKEETEGRIHEVGAVMCLAFSQLWVGFTDPWMLLPWIAYIIYSAVYMICKWDDYFINTFIRTRPMFWLEIYALLTTYMTLLI